jgi:tRNA-modifying protein YgfZ
MPIAFLPDRGVVEVAGEDRASFLQGLVSNDVATLAPGRAAWAALLTPQGKWLADFFVLADGGQRLLLECERAQAPLLVQTLLRFRLRSKVALRDASSDFFVGAAWDGAEPPAGTLAFRDPRLEEAGWRFLAMAPVEGADDYDLHRLSLGLPAGSRDLDSQKTVLLEAGFDELGGISWTKGCYMGQELTARTRYRGLLKRRLVPVSVAGPLPGPGTPVLDAAGAEVGEMRSGHPSGPGLALLRLEAITAAEPLRCAEAVLTPRIPAWMRLPERAATPAGST